MRKPLFIRTKDGVFNQVPGVAGQRRRAARLCNGWMFPSPDGNGTLIVMGATAKDIGAGTVNNRPAWVMDAGV